MIKKKSKYTKAIALHYDGKSNELPMVAAKGHYLLADEIVKVARRYGVPVIEQKELAVELDQVPNNEAIPSRLYEAVAILINQIDRIFKK